MKDLVPGTVVLIMDGPKCGQGGTVDGASTQTWKVKTNKGEVKEYPASV